MGAGAQPSHGLGRQRLRGPAGAPSLTPVRILLALALLGMLALAGCVSAGGPFPSLAPRAAEAIDPRVPIPSEPTVGPADPALSAQIAALVAAGLSGRAAFDQAMAEAERLTGGAGGPGSESWIQAQQALSGAIAARQGTARALSDIDALAAARLQARGDLPPGDLNAINAASAELGTLDHAQVRRIAAVQARLGL
jgi:hypothetical protein